MQIVCRQAAEHETDALSKRAHTYITVDDDNNDDDDGGENDADNAVLMIVLSVTVCVSVCGTDVYTLIQYACILAYIERM